MREPLVRRVVRIRIGHLRTFGSEPYENVFFEIDVLKARAHDEKARVVFERVEAPFGGEPIVIDRALEVLARSARARVAVDERIVGLKVADVKRPLLEPSFAVRAQIRGTEPREFAREVVLHVVSKRVEPVREKEIHERSRTTHVRENARAAVGGLRKALVESGLEGRPRPVRRRR